MSKVKYDFSGYVTKNDILCTDGRTIRHNAFSADNGRSVPLIWNHDHMDPSNILGNVYLQNRNDGVYGYASLNGTTKAQDAKELLKHGDINSFSIYAKIDKSVNKNVLAGSIKEVSLVLAGANSGATIENLYFEHADGSSTMSENEAIIKLNLELDPSEGEYDDGVLEHADKSEGESNDTSNKEDTKVAGKGRTVQDVIDTMNEEQLKVLQYLVGQAANTEDEDDNKNKEDSNMKHNAFDNETNNSEYIAHAQDLRNDILVALNNESRIKGQITSLADFIQHDADAYGIEDIEFLFPDARELNTPPEFIKREDDWVSVFMNGTKHLPFTRVKTTFADITKDEARARGYKEKGTKKLDEVIELLHRDVSPTTIYKKQKLDRDDILDITSFDVVVWLKQEMRMMLNEEIARAALISDGRSGAAQDKIKEDKIIPIWKDDDLFTIPVRVVVAEDATDDQKSEALIRAVLKARKNYKGSGNPTFFTTEDVLTDLLLIEDGIGRRKYNTTEDVARAIRCSKIVTVPVMEGQERTVTLEGGGTEDRTLLGIVVNTIDYSFGADKGGNVAMFEDFDIDFNQQKYLMETRCSGMLTKPYSAMAVELVVEANG